MRYFAISCVTALSVLATTPASAKKLKFINFDVPGATSTFPASVNAHNDIAGYYKLGDNYLHGFLRLASGAMTKFEVSNALETEPLAINFSGIVSGSYMDSASVRHGFTRAKDGTITTFDPPGSTNTYTATINDKGAIVGYFVDANNIGQAYLRRLNGTFAIFDIPGAAYTAATSINNNGVVAGEFYNAPYHKGFVRSTDGTIATFEISGAEQTVPASINDKGQIAGRSAPQGAGVPEGFERGPAGKIITFARDHDDIDVSQINDGGWIAGTDADDLHFHGFVRASNGNLIAVDDPKAGKDFTEGTVPSGINNNLYVTGYYSDSHRIYHGFLVKAVAN